MSTIRLTKQEDGKRWWLAWVSNELEVHYLSPTEIDELARKPYPDRKTLLEGRK